MKPQLWCLRCCTVAQIEYHSKIAEQLPALKRRLEDIDKAATKDAS